MSILENGKPTRGRRIDIERQRDDPANFGLLTAAEKEAIREKARLTVQNELKDREEKALLDQYLKEEREAADPKQQLVPIFLDLAPVGGPKMDNNYVMLDGVQYFHGAVHYVNEHVYRVLLEQMNRGWAHEEETEVRDVQTRRRSRAPAHVGIGNFTDNRQPRDMVVSSSQLAGVSPSSLLGMR
jgi:hypothetical protein